MCPEQFRKVAKDLIFLIIYVKDLTLFAIVCILLKTNAMYQSRPNVAEIAQEP